MSKETKNQIMGLVSIFVVVIVTIFALHEINKSLEEHYEREDQEAYQRVSEHCEFIVIEDNWGGYECWRPCMAHTLDDKKCVPKGCVDTGFLSSDCDFYVCEGYGDIKPHCTAYWEGTQESYCEMFPEERNNVFCIGWKNE